MNPASILGIGAVTPLGRDLNVVAQSSRDACVASSVDLRSTATQASQLPQPRRVSDDLLINPTTATQLRRADRFTRMAVIAATDAWNAAKETTAGIPPERIGLILSSGFGPHCRGFKFLDGVLDAGDAAASPTDFSHSVHGAASAYISRMLDIRGPALALTDFEIGFEEAIRIAQCWLSENACDRILIGAVEELGEVFLDCANRMLVGRENIHPGESAVFLMLGPSTIAGVAKIDSTACPTTVDLLIVEDPTITPTPVLRYSEEPGLTARAPGSSEYLRTGVAEASNVPSIQAKQTISVTQSFGHSASATAFSVLAGVLQLRGPIDTAATLRTSSEGRTVTLLLEK